MSFPTRGSAALFASIMVLVALLSLCECQGDLLFSESFAYTNGALTSVGAGLWTTHSGAAGEVQVRNGQMLLEQAKSEDVNAQLPGGPYPATTNVMLYWSLRLTATALPGGSGAYFAHLNTTSARSRVFVATNNAAGGKFRVGLANGGSSADVFVPADLDLNSECVVLVRFNPATSASTIWVDPQSEADPGFAAEDSASSVSVSRMAFRQASGIGSLRVDDVRAGTSWVDVYAMANPTEPAITSQPKSQTVFAGGMVSFSSAANGTRPIRYQWFWNGAAVPDATNTTLLVLATGTNRAGAYSMMASNAGGVATSEPAVLTVNPAPPRDGRLRVVTWNVGGNGATNWSIDSPQVQAISRTLGYLAPDIITFNEIPVGFTCELTNWVAAFLPGYHLATNSGSDGYIRSAVASRFQILSSSKHLHGVSLAPYGTGNFARDLFQARIRVPGYAQPLDVFTTHLKATTSTWQVDADKRAAEAKAISNFIAHVYLPTNNGAPYLLTGDMNEDIARPDTSKYASGLPIQNLVNPQTGLALTTPVNPVTGQDFTMSMESTLSVRFDYVLPCAMLFSNISSGQVFRSDVLTNPPVAEVYSTDSRAASDHLPVMAAFENPYPAPEPIVRVGEITTLVWESEPGQIFRIRSTQNPGLPLSGWDTVAGQILANGYRSSLSITSSAPRQFYSLELLKQE